MVKDNDDVEISFRLMRYIFVFVFILFSTYDNSGCMKMEMKEVEFDTLARIIFQILWAFEGDDFLVSSRCKFEQKK